MAKALTSKNNISVKLRSARTKFSRLQVIEKTHSFPFIIIMGLKIKHKSREEKIKNSYIFLYIFLGKII